MLSITLSLWLLPRDDLDFDRSRQVAVRTDYDSGRSGLEIDVFQFENMSTLRALVDAVPLLRVRGGRLGFHKIRSDDGLGHAGRAFGTASQAFGVSTLFLPS